MDMSHDVMAKLALVALGGRKIDVVDRGSICAGEISRPNSASASASHTQSCRQVRNFRCAPHSALISREA
jgi:hypothetical protein